jgi:hypothetical protein
MCLELGWALHASCTGNVVTDYSLPLVVLTPLAWNPSGQRGNQSGTAWTCGCRLNTVMIVELASPT